MVENKKLKKTNRHIAGTIQIIKKRLREDPEALRSDVREVKVKEHEYMFLDL